MSSTVKSKKSSLVDRVVESRQIRLSDSIKLVQSNMQFIEPIIEQEFLKAGLADSVDIYLTRMEFAFLRDGVDSQLGQGTLNPTLCFILEKAIQSKFNLKATIDLSIDIVGGIRRPKNRLTVSLPFDSIEHICKQEG